MTAEVLSFSIQQARELSSLTEDTTLNLSLAEPGIIPAGMAPVPGGELDLEFPAVESRIKVAVLLGGGFDFSKKMPEVDEINFAPRVKVPTLMVNGRFDNFYPLDTSQNVMFRFLGVPEKDKTPCRLGGRPRPAIRPNDERDSRLVGQVSGSGEMKFGGAVS